jgi:hypothetical protein
VEDSVDLGESAKLNDFRTINEGEEDDNEEDKLSDPETEMSRIFCKLEGCLRGEDGDGFD